MYKFDCFEALKKRGEVGIDVLLAFAFLLANFEVTIFFLMQRN